MTNKFRYLAILAPIAALAACSDGPEAELPYGTPQMLMANEMQPTADIYWGSVRFVSELVDGEVVETDYRPETDEEWQTVADSAAHIQELGKALLTPAYADGRADDWTDYAQGLIDLSIVAEQAAIDHDPDAVFEVGGNVYNVCKACHQSYPPAELAEEGMTVDDLPSESSPSAEDGS